MTLRLLCCLVYKRLTDLVERRTAVDIQVAVAAKAAGAEVDIPSWTDARTEFDAALSETPRAASTVDERKRTLRVALGLD